MTGRIVDDRDAVTASLPDGFVPGTVAPFVMRYGTDFLVAMQRASVGREPARPVEEVEPA